MEINKREQMPAKETHNGHAIIVVSNEVEPGHWNLYVSVCSNDNLTSRFFLFSRRFPKVAEAEAIGFRFAKNWIDNGKPEISSTPALPAEGRWPFILSESEGPAYAPPAD
jgi:hypothetical protein